MIAILALVLAAVPAPKLVTSTEPDGMDLVVVTLPQDERCSARIVVRAGADDDPVGKAGLAHLVEHFAFKSELGTRLMLDAAGRVNAFTFGDGTVFTLDTSAALCRDDLGRLLNVVSEGKLKRAWLAPEKGVVLHEAVYSAQPLAGGLEQGLWGGRSIPIVGTQKTRDDITLDDVVRFYRDHYTPAEMALVVAGPLTPDEVRESVAAHFRIPPSDAPPRPARKLPLLTMRGERVMTGQYAGLSAHVARFEPSEVRACASAEALIELRLLRDASSGGTELKTRCLRANGSLLLVTTAFGPEADRGRVRSVVERAWTSTEPLSAADRKLLERHLERRRGWMAMSPALLAGLLVEDAKWFRGEALFSLVTARLAGGLASPDELKALPEQLGALNRVFMYGSEGK